MAKNFHKQAKCNGDPKTLVWCTGLKRIMSEANRKGINTVILMGGEAGPRTVGVGFKRVEADSPTLFNFCPFCGTDLRTLRG